MSNSTDVDKCRDVCQANLIKSSEPYQKMLIPHETTLYHYTNATGLLGIIESNTLWASEASFLNDPVELHHGANKTKQALTKYVAENPHRLSKKQIKLLELLPRLDLYNDKYREQNQVRAHMLDAYAILSFSTNPDSLLLWREYTNNGNGYAIGFSKSVLDGALFSGPIVHIPGRHSLRRVIYEDQQKLDLVLQVINVYMDYFKNNSLPFEIVFNLLDQELIWLLPVLKPSEYAEENEVRYVREMQPLLFSWSLPEVEIINDREPHRIPHEIVKSRVPDEDKHFVQNFDELPIFKQEPVDVVFKVKNDIIVPMLRLKMHGTPRLKISEVVIGPSLNQTLAEKGVRRLCDRYYYTGEIPITFSKLAYRSHL